MSDDFDWDEWNIRKSQLKHGITNYETESVFDDPNKRIRTDEKHSVLEERYFCIGKSRFDKMLSIAFTIRDGKIRIISSRPSNKRERFYYEN
jgi:uncharacterized DUF497 family protein